MFDLVPDFSHFFQGSALRVFEMPLDQLLLHLSDNRFRTRVFDGAAHCHNEACVPDRPGRKGLRMIGGDVYSAFSHSVYDGRLILVDGIVPALTAFIPSFLAKASAIWLRPAFSTQTNSTGPLAKLESLEESIDESRH